MPIALLIDGYNIIAPVAAPRKPRSLPAASSPGHNPAKWLQRERTILIERLATHLPASVRENTCVVFDAKTHPAGSPNHIVSSEIEIRFAVDHPEADDLIEELIASHSVPKSLTVVSSDHRIQAAARRRKCVYFDSQNWFDHLLDGDLLIAKIPPRRKTQASPTKAPSPPAPQRSRTTAREIPDAAPEIDDVTLSRLLREHGGPDEPE
ncbi:MAG: NYN domain-containing protein [Planctomycetota bacterium]